MMRYLLSALIILCTYFPGPAQNLVPNPGFESFSLCPITYGELEKAVPWFKPTSGSSDYFHSCSPANSPVGVPIHYNGGYQYARNGDGYAGIATYKDNYPNYREYLETQLISPLKSGQCYYFEMFTNKKNTARYASDNLGAHIRKGIFYSMTSTNLSVSPQFVSPPGQVIKDTVEWARINGYYNAQGGEDHLIIGNFGSDLQTSTIVHIPSSVEVYAFYYIDDVSITEVAYAVDLGNDTILCEGETLHLDISLPGATYLWHDGLTSPEREISQAGKYAVKVSIGQCQPLSDSIFVYYTTPPVVSFGPDTSICLGHKLLLSASNPYSTYVWQDGFSGDNYRVSQTGLYWAEAENLCGFSRDSILVEFTECSDLLFAPNAFTPNADGINDQFSIQGAGIESFELMIYDRWGQQVFYSRDPAKAWDGSSNGTPCAGGIFHWIVTYTGGGVTLLEKEQRKTGFVLLVR